jgi:lipopolysaccharide transport system permease protein
MANTHVFEAADNRVKMAPGGYFGEALRYRAFFGYWVRRSLAVRYRQTSFGWAWAVFDPLWSSLIYVIVFSFIIRVNTGPVPYPLFILLNIVLWNYFSRIVSRSTSSITANMDLLVKVQFPREFLPLGICAESATDLAIGLAIAGGLAFYYRFPLPAIAPVAIISILVCTIFALGLGFYLAAFTAIVRDLLIVIPLVLQLLFYLSPVFYPLAAIPPRLHQLYFLNPLTAIFASYQEALLYGQLGHGKELLATGIASLFVLVSGYYVFKRLEWQFADLL